MTGRPAGKRGHGRGPARGAGAAGYGRVVRVDRLLHEVVAEELERLSDVDGRLRLLTVTAVRASPDLRQATVLLASLDQAARLALEESRVRLQAAIGRQVRLKRTPQLSFAIDPAIVAGQRIEDILRRLPPQPPDDGQAGEGPEADV